MNDINTSIRRLWMAYKLYHIVGALNDSDSSEYATRCTNSYIDYLREMIETNYPDWDYQAAIENQVRILRGFIECYDRPVIRDKVVYKTRWSK